MTRGSKIRLGIVFGAVSLSLSHAGQAHADWSLDFNSPLPPNFITVGLSNVGNPSPTFTSSIEGGVLRLTDSVLPASGGAALGIGTIANQTFNDVRVTGVLNPAGGSRDDLVLLARADVSTLTTYAAGIKFGLGGGSGDSYIVKFIDGQEIDDIRSSDATQGSQPPLNIDNNYFLEFDLVGDLLSLRVYDTPGGNLLSQVSFIDTGIGGPAIASGTVGVANQAVGNALINSTWDNVTATTLVPEPTGVLTCVLVGALGLATRRRRS